MLETEFDTADLRIGAIAGLRDVDREAVGGAGDGFVLAVVEEDEFLDALVKHVRGKHAGVLRVEFETEVEVGGERGLQAGIAAGDRGDFAVRVVGVGLARLDVAILWPRDGGPHGAAKHETIGVSVVHMDARRDVVVGGLGVGEPSGAGGVVVA